MIIKIIPDPDPTGPKEIHNISLFKGTVSRDE